jgi:hypothetical protein
MKQRWHSVQTVANRTVETMHRMMSRTDSLGIQTTPTNDIDCAPEEDTILLSQWLQEKDQIRISPPVQIVTLLPERSLCDTYHRNIPDILHLLERQETLEAGQKALIDNGVLVCDYVYASSGDMGRWFMNSVIRPSAIGRTEVCAHLEWLVSEIASVYPLSIQDLSYRPRLYEQTCRIIQTLEILVDTYPRYVRLQRCLSYAKDIRSGRNLS